jgi:hypothetical protein
MTLTVKDKRNDKIILKQASKQASKISLSIPLAIASVFALSAPAQAALYTSSIGSLIPGYLANDDGTFNAIDLGFNVNFFGTTYSSIYANNNGNITFGNSTDAFNPSPLDGQTTSPMIAPYWTDLDSRNSPHADSGVYLTQTTNQAIVTWKNMGYYSRNYSGITTFQLVLNNPATAVNNQVIGFFFDDLSSGTDTHSVTVGFGDGLGSINSGEVSYSAGPSSEVSSQLNQREIWFDLNNGRPIEVPKVPVPGAVWLFASGLMGLLGLKRRRQA